MTSGNKLMSLRPFGKLIRVAEPLFLKFIPDETPRVPNASLSRQFSRALKKKDGNTATTVVSRFFELYDMLPREADAEKHALFLERESDINDVLSVFQDLAKRSRGDLEAAKLSFILRFFNVTLIDRTELNIGLIRLVSNARLTSHVISVAHRLWKFTDGFLSKEYEENPGVVVYLPHEDLDREILSYFSTIFEISHYDYKEACDTELLDGLICDHKSEIYKLIMRWLEMRPDPNHECLGKQSISSVVNTAMFLGTTIKSMAPWNTGRRKSLEWDLEDCWPDMFFGFLKMSFSFLEYLPKTKHDVLALDIRRLRQQTSYVGDVFIEASALSVLKSFCDLFKEMEPKRISRKRIKKEFIRIEKRFANLIYRLLTINSLSLAREARELVSILHKAKVRFSAENSRRVAKGLFRSLLDFTNLEAKDQEGKEEVNYAYAVADDQIVDGTMKAYGFHRLIRAVPGIPNTANMWLLGLHKEVSTFDVTKRSAIHTVGPAFHTFDLLSTLLGKDSLFLQSARDEFSRKEGLYVRVVQCWMDRARDLPALRPTNDAFCRVSMLVALEISSIFVVYPRALEEVERSKQYDVAQWSCDLMKGHLDLGSRPAITLLQDPDLLSKLSERSCFKLTPSRLYEVFHANPHDEFLHLFILIIIKSMPMNHNFFEEFKSDWCVRFLQAYVDALSDILGPAWFNRMVHRQRRPKLPQEFDALFRKTIYNFGNPNLEDEVLPDDHQKLRDNQQGVLEAMVEFFDNTVKEEREREQDAQCKGSPYPYVDKYILEQRECMFRGHPCAKCCRLELERNEFQKCGAGKECQARYCSVECKNLDWKRHKKTCLARAKDTQARQTTSRMSTDKKTRPTTVSED